MNIINKILLPSLILIISLKNVYGCSCTNVPEIFIENIKVDHIIFSGTVLEHIEIPNKQKYIISHHSLTKIKVKNWYQNKMASDTIYYANGCSSMCLCSIESAKIGDELILKTRSEYLYSDFLFMEETVQSFKDFIETYNNKPIVGYGICDVSILLLENNLVKGNITKNYEARKYKFERFVSKLNKKLAYNLTLKRINGNKRIQEMNIDKFDKLMRRRWNSLL